MTPAQLGQDAMNAYDSCDREGLRKLLERLVALADAAGLQRLSVVELEKLRDKQAPSIDPSE